MRGTAWPRVKVIGGVTPVSVFQRLRKQYVSSSAGAVTSRCVPCPWWQLGSVTPARTSEITHLLSSAQQGKPMPWEEAVPSPCPCFSPCSCSRVGHGAVSAGGLGQPAFIVCNPMFKALLFYLLQIILHLNQPAPSFTSAPCWGISGC